MTLHRIISLALVAMLTLTSQAMAVARGASGPAGQMVLCIGSDAVVVFVDAEGLPTTAPHFCPDCVLLADEKQDTPFAVIVAAVWPAALPAVSNDLSVPACFSVKPKTRAPPFPV